MVNALVFFLVILESFVNYSFIFQNFLIFSAIDTLLKLSQLFSISSYLSF